MTFRFPKTDSIQELARFWDNHELTDFQDELEKVTQPVFQRTRACGPISLRLTPSEAAAVRRLAKSAGVSQDVLIHKWIHQQLKPRRKPSHVRG